MKYKWFGNIDGWVYFVRMRCGVRPVYHVAISILPSHIHCLPYTNYGFIIYTQVRMTKLLVMLSVAVRRTCIGDRYTLIGFDQFRHLTSSSFKFSGLVGGFFKISGFARSRLRLHSPQRRPRTLQTTHLTKEQTALSFTFCYS